MATLYTDDVWAVAVTPDGRRAISASDDETLRVWDLATGEPIATFSVDGRLSCCTVASDGRAIVAGDRGGLVYFLRLEGVKAVTSGEFKAVHYSGNRVVG